MVRGSSGSRLRLMLARGWSRPFRKASPRNVLLQTAGCSAVIGIVAGFVSALLLAGTFAQMHIGLDEASYGDYLVGVFFGTPLVHPTSSELMVPLFAAGSEIPFGWIVLQLAAGCAPLGCLCRMPAGMAQAMLVQSGGRRRRWLRECLVMAGGVLSYWVFVGAGIAVWLVLSGGAFELAVTPGVREAFMLSGVASTHEGALLLLLIVLVSEGVWLFSQVVRWLLGDVALLLCVAIAWCLPCWIGAAWLPTGYLMVARLDGFVTGSYSLRLCVPVGIALVVLAMGAGLLVARRKDFFRGEDDVI